MTEITPFVSWEIPTFEQIQDCKAVALRRGIDNGYKLTREDKDWITANVNGNSYFLTSSLTKYVFYNWLINNILYLCVT